jgi:hypothetical protein
MSDRKASYPNVQLKGKRNKQKGETDSEVLRYGQKGPGQNSKSE